MSEKQIVEAGYDQIAEVYAAWGGQQRVTDRQPYIDVLLHGLPEGAAVLELGCGTGVPVTRALAARFAVTAVDLARRNIEIARQNVPQATFHHADMSMLDYPAESFDGVAAFYSLIHVPRDEHLGLLQKIATWLRPDGMLVATMGTHDQAGLVEHWLGTEMYWSSFDALTNQQLVEQAGLKIDQAQEETVEEDGQPVMFLWIVARKLA